MRWQDYVLLSLLVAAYLLYLLRQRMRKAKQGSRTGGYLTRKEETAWKMLQQQGYQLSEVHPAVPVTFKAGLKARQYTFEGGFLVKKDGKTYLVKIKPAGEGVFLSDDLRRDLLVDYFLFQPAAVIMFDASKKKLQEVSCTIAGTGSLKNYVIQGLLVILIVIGLAILYRLYT